MADLYTMLGFWFWAALGIVLLVLEIFVAGIFLMWFGIAALVTSVLLWFLGNATNVSPWQFQVTLFIILSAVSVYVGLKFFRQSAKTDQPLLNQRTEQMVGQVATLNDDMVNGHGYVRLDDTVWRVVGPNLASGNKVRLLKYVDGAFLVENAD